MDANLLRQGLTSDHNHGHSKGDHGPGHGRDDAPRGTLHSLPEPHFHAQHEKSGHDPVRDMFAQALKEQAGERDPDDPPHYSEDLITRLLAMVPVFNTCSKGLVRKLATLAKVHVHESGSTIVNQGEAGSGLLVLLAGLITLNVDHEKTVKLFPRDFFGETLMLSLERDWTASLVAEERCEVLEITTTLFWEALGAFPEEHQHYQSIVASNTSCLSGGALRGACEVFHGLSERCLCSIDCNLVRRIHFPGEQILAQGNEGDELHILLSGEVSVTKTYTQDNSVEHDSGEEDSDEGDGEEWSNGVDNDAVEQSKVFKDLQASIQATAADNEQETDEKGKRKVMRSRAKTEVYKLRASDSEAVCFGELGLLGLQDIRTATVVAQTVCQVRVLYRQVFLKELETHSQGLETQHMSKFLDSRYKGADGGQQRELKEVKIFKDLNCSDEFLSCVAALFAGRMFLRDQKIVSEGTSDDRCMYIIASGNASVLKGTEKVSTLSSGASFGELTLFGLVPTRQTTVVATETCFVERLAQVDMVKALEAFPQERSKVLRMALKHNEAINGEEVSDDLDFKAAALRVVMRAMRNSNIFSEIDSSFVEEISGVSIDRIFMPGEVVVEQGQLGDSMFIIISGRAAVFKREEDPAQAGDSSPTPPRGSVFFPQGKRLTAVQVMQSMHGNQRRTKSNGSRFVPRNSVKPFSPGAAKNGKPSPEPQKSKVARGPSTRIGVLTAGSIGGELAMLGVSGTRSATIEAETFCIVWEVCSEVALPLIQKSPNVQQTFLDVIVKNLEHTVPEVIDSLPLFRNFDRHFRMRLSLYAERKAFFPDQKIFSDGQVCDRLYIISVGQGTLDKRGILVRTCTAGEHFNCLNMLGVHKTLHATLTAERTCHTLIISRPSYLQVLENIPSSPELQECKEEMKREEMLEFDKFKKMVQVLGRRSFQKKFSDMFELQSKVSSSSAALDTLDENGNGSDSPANHPQNRQRDDEHIRKTAKKIMHVWRNYAIPTARKRRERMQRIVAIDEWAQRSRRARAVRERHDEMQAMLSERCSYATGPLTSADQHFQVEMPLIPPYVANMLQLANKASPRSGGYNSNGGSTDASPSAATSIPSPGQAAVLLARASNSVAASGGSSPSRPNRAASAAPSLAGAQGGAQGVPLGAVVVNGAALPWKSGGSPARAAVKKPRLEALSNLYLDDAWEVRTSQSSCFAGPPSPSKTPCRQVAGTAPSSARTPRRCYMAAGPLTDVPVLPYLYASRRQGLEIAL